ncbi:MAG: hypothetical protein A3J28_01215 [Acidobacteria bacterium RIFCSPLOWO2_12_FULL_60_22]|nr:MAG: hypothetical protein A3J28_01215 [Acidobacteria bacterium RIFCSPLOWO2_12_FULL_60_22]
MSTTELIEYLSITSKASLRQPLQAWMDNNHAFRTFVEKYKDKIRKKLQANDNDYLRDVLWELEVAYLLLRNPDFTVEYEPYGVGKFRSPDYLVSRSGADSFCVEAKKIREGSSEAQIRAWEREMKETIRGVPSRVAVTLNIHVMQPDSDLLDQLESQRDPIKAAFRQWIVEADAQLEPKQSCCYPIVGFEGIVDIEITRPISKAKPGPTAFHIGSRPIWYKQDEYKKFSDTVCEKLGQLRSGMANVLAIGSASETHEDFDCGKAIEDLRTLAAKSDDAFFRYPSKGFEGASDFLAQFRYLSGVVFRSSWWSNFSGRENASRNFVWRNPQAAQTLDDQITQYLSEMD